MKPILVLAVGNPSRGDDAFGPILADRLEALAVPDVEVIRRFQLAPEHALDLVGRERVIFVDAGEGTPEPFELRRVEAKDDFTYTSHALSPEAVLWRPLAFTPEEKSDDNRHSNNYWNVGRLKPGATREQAQAQVDALNAGNLERFPTFKELLENAGFRTLVDPLPDHIVRAVKPTLFLLWGGASFVLLIGCVNVANLVLVRARSRLKELSRFRQKLAMAASKGDFDAADELFSLYEERSTATPHTPGKQQSDGVAEARKASLARSGGSSASGVVPTGDGKKFFTRTELMEMRIKRPDEFDSRQEESLAAYR